MEIVKVPQYLEAAEWAMQSTLNEFQNWLPVSYELKRASNHVSLEFQGIDSLTQLLGFTMEPYFYYKGYWKLKSYRRSCASFAASELWQIHIPHKLFFSLDVGFHQVRARNFILDYPNQGELITRTPSVFNPYCLTPLPEEFYRATLADCQKDLYEKTRWLETIGAQYYQLHSGILLSHKTLIDIHQSLSELLDLGLLVFTPDWNLGTRSCYMEWIVLNPKACIVPWKSDPEGGTPAWDPSDKRRKLGIPGWCLYISFTKNL